MKKISELIRFVNAYLKQNNLPTLHYALPEDSEKRLLPVYVITKDMAFARTFDLLGHEKSVISSIIYWVSNLQ